MTAISAPLADGPRRRPFGVLVVALIQLGVVVVSLVAYLASWALPWEGVIATYLSDHAWARIAIVGLAVLIVLAAFGMWRLRPWGWALMVAIVGVSLIMDLVAWWRTGGDSDLAIYARMALDVVSAFYLNTRSVQDAFQPPPSPPVAPVAGTSSAGRTDP